MPPADVIERVRAIAGRIAASYGLEVFDVQFRREASGMVLRVQIDRPGPAATAEESVSVDDCARGEGERRILRLRRHRSHGALRGRRRCPRWSRDGDGPARRRYW